MIKIIMTTLALLAAKSLYSQQRFVEVEVQDTIHTQPREITYIILLEPHYNELIFAASDSVSEGEMEEIDYYEQELEREQAIRRELEETQKELISTLHSKGYRAEIGKPNRYQLGYDESYSIQVTVSSSSELEKLVDILEERKGLYGLVGSLDYKNEEEKEAELMQKLIRKAEKKAEMIASLTGNSIGQIIELSEADQIDNFSVQLMKTIITSEYEDWTDNKSEDGMYGILTNSIRVKYELK